MSDGVPGAISERVPPASDPAKSEPRPWGLLACFAWYVLIFEIASRAYDWMVTASGFGDLQANSNALHVVAIVLSWAKSFAILAFAVWLTGVPPRRYLGWVRPRASDVTLGVLAVLAVNEIGDVLAGVIAANAADYRASLAQGISPLLYALQPWPSVIFAPVLEESFFRGLLWVGVQSRLGNRGALLISSAMFVLAHDFYDDSGVHWSYVADLFVSGLAFGWLRWRSGGTIAPMIAHAVFNALEAPIIIALTALGVV
jgi:membrane protease YdiL (CAAX protease family)